MIQPLWRRVWRFLKKLKIELPYDAAIPLLGIYPEKTIIQKESCTKLFIAALFTIARTWKQPKCPSTDEWIKKIWHIYTMEYYSAIKRNEIELFVVRWMDLESVILSEVSQKEKNKYWGFPGGTVVGSPPANAGGTGLSPGSGGSHVPRSSWAHEPQLLSLRVWSLCSATREAAIVRGPRTAMKSGPRLPQLERALAQKRRPNTVINK